MDQYIRDFHARVIPSQTAYNVQNLVQTAYIFTKKSEVQQEILTK